jgi:hypothetical protein
MWWLALALAAPPPIAAPCCGAKPIERTTDELEPLPPVRPPLFHLGRTLPAGRTLEDELCSVLPSCDSTTERSTVLRSDPLELGQGHTGWVQMIRLANEPVLRRECWVFVVRSPAGGLSYTRLDEMGAGTKGGTHGALKRASLVDGAVWIEIQEELVHTASSRRVTLLGYVVSLRESLPDAVALRIPIWMDGEDLPGPRQIDVSLESRLIVVTRRTDEVYPEQEIWLHRWSR